MDSAQLEAAIAQHLGAIQSAAWNAPAGGGPEWDALLRYYGVPPLDPSERQMIVQHMRIARGAVPAELRMVLSGLKAWIEAQLPSLGPSGARAQQMATDLVDREMAAYERALGIPPLPPLPPPTPAAPSLGSIFANAHATAKEVPWAGQTYKAVGSLTCVHCGGPQEQPQDFMCRYCRRPIAGTIKPTV